MKRIIITLLVVLVTLNLSARKKKTDVVINRSDSSITFVVDKGLPKPTYHLKDSLTGQYYKYKGQYDKVLKSSIDTMKVFNLSFINIVIKAYQEHRPLELSPDDIWLCISQGFARHVVNNAEALRDKFVSHKDKMKLIVELPKPLYLDDGVTPNPEVDWVKIFDTFVSMMKENTKGKVTDIVCADFTTTTVDSRIASQITLMYSMKEYFEYWGRYTGCGFPYITLKGTPDDWKKVLDKARKLEQYDLGWWTKDLYPVLEEFVAASKGKPNPKFWRNMVKKHTFYDVGGCGSRHIFKNHRYDGWLLTLFPYDEKGRTKSKADLKSLVVRDFLPVDFMYDCDGVVTKMELCAGFAGAEENLDTYGLKPSIGWLVREKSGSDHGVQMITVEELDEILKQER